MSRYVPSSASPSSGVRGQIRGQEDDSGRVRLMGVIYHDRAEVKIAANAGAFRLTVPIARNKCPI